MKPAARARSRAAHEGEELVAVASILGAVRDGAEVAAEDQAQSLRVLLYPCGISGALPRKGELGGKLGIEPRKFLRRLAQMPVDLGQFTDRLRRQVGIGQVGIGQVGIGQVGIGLTSLL